MNQLYKNLGLTVVFLTAPIIYYYYYYDDGQSRTQFLDSEEKTEQQNYYIILDNIYMAKKGDTFKKGTQLVSGNVVIDYVKGKDPNGRYTVDLRHKDGIYKPVRTRLTSPQLLNPRAPENAMDYLKSKQPQEIIQEKYGRFTTTTKRAMTRKEVAKQKANKSKTKKSKTKSTKKSKTKKSKKGGGRTRRRKGKQRRKGTKKKRKRKSL